MTAQRQKSALDLVEEATSLLRNAPMGAFAAYYLGTLPFLLAFLFFSSDMGVNPAANDHAAPAAFGVAVLFVWMTVLQAVFAQSLRSRLTGSPPAAFRRLLFVQSSLQPTKLFMVPLGAILAAPLPGFLAFYQNLMAVSYENRSLSGIVGAARRQARLSMGQNWSVLGFVTVLAVVLFLNIAVALIIVPQLLKSFLGIDSPLTRNTMLSFNSTLFTVALALTYAIVDPVIKAVYVLRCFYGESIATGEDLKARLQSIAIKAAVVLVMAGAALHAQPPQAPRVQQLNRSIDNVLKRPEFSRRFPVEQAKKKSWFARTLDDWGERINRWVDDFFRWLKERFRSTPSVNHGRPGPPKVRVWLYLLLGVAIAIFAVLFARAFRRRSRVPVVAQPVARAAPDLASDQTSADQLPADEWLRTARECIARNELRLAVRALYLASLAYLGSRSLIAIARSKSNSDYARELRRRARTKPAVVAPFGDTISIFERSWYGMHDVDLESVAQVEANLVAMRSCVEG